MLWLPTFLRTRDESRDWRRPWRDPPGLLPQGKCCCGPCTVTVDCCEMAIPCRMHATIEITGICSVTAELDLCKATFGDQWWGLKTIGSHTWVVSVICNVGGTSSNGFICAVFVYGSGCNGGASVPGWSNWGVYLEPDCQDAFEDTSTPGNKGSNAMVSGPQPISHSCSPLSLVWQQTINGSGSPGFDSGACACGEPNLGDGESYQITVTATE